MNRAKIRTISTNQMNSLNFLVGLMDKEGTGNQRLQGNTSVGIPSTQRQERLALSKLLVHRAQLICSQNRSSSLFDRVKQLGIDTVYPDDVLLSCIKLKLANFAADNPCFPEKYLVYLEFSLIGNVSSKF